MQSFVIAESPCPHCQNPRTARSGALGFCFNCRRQWRTDAQPATVKPEYPFTAAERGRLEVYRAAVRAGFYSG
jgi:hypothetical protein